MSIETRYGLIVLSTLSGCVLGFVIADSYGFIIGGFSAGLLTDRFLR